METDPLIKSISMGIVETDSCLLNLYSLLCLGITFYYPTSKTPIPDEVQAGKTAITYTGLEMVQAYNDVHS